MDAQRSIQLILRCLGNIHNIIYKYCPILKLRTLLSVAKTFIKFIEKKIVQEFVNSL